MSELKNGFLTAEEVMDILQVKQSKAYQIIRQLNKELSGMGLITVPGRVDANYFKKKLFYEVNILVSGNLDSGILETDIPEEGNSLIGLFTTYQVLRYCQAQSRFAVL